jgi:hypothetical protein
MGFVQRSFFMWILRGKNGSLSEQANTMFEMVWQGMANPQQQLTHTSNSGRREDNTGSF